MRSEVELNTAVFAVVLGTVAVIWWLASAFVENPHWYQPAVPWLLLAWPFLVFAFYRIQVRAQPKNPPNTF